MTTASLDKTTLLNTCLNQLKTHTNSSLDAKQRSLIESVIKELDSGTIRAIDADGKSVAYVRVAILCYLRMMQSTSIAGMTQSYDKVPNKLSHNSTQTPSFRVCPPTHVRYGAYIAPNCVLMPCFVNIGAFVDSGTMIDTWSTVGSCAQIGKNCHISGGTGIGGVLEPMSAQPVIIEDNCFVGARCEIAEGVTVKQGAVIAAGTIITQSTVIYDRTQDSFLNHGTIPPNAVAVPTYLPDKSGRYSKYAVMIVKYADNLTRSKTSIEQLLRTE